ncbi:carbohydrate ABC transporter permease [Paenibacillus planticolens]|uniref:ABC transporter permease subunit n=1 Tax=Paenibacillus planticolens TaxID=2654976 RepID=A0ABX1ZJ44_9BACL|nr:carbohydrate ABC transporter permease [Paenibacillus planticolens]NOU98664.1 ABC transporter permease subunit [Paenibacillus planticolens]
MGKAPVWKKSLIYAFLSIIGVFNIMPILWMLMNSFKSEQDYSKHPLTWPKAWFFSNYMEAWKVAKLGVYFWNSIFVTAVAVVATVLLGALASYFLSRFIFKGQKLVSGIFLLGMVIPIHATIIPTFITMNKIGLLNTHLSLILAYVAFHLSLTVYILVGFMKSYPKDIEESAIMDGSGVYRIFWSIILPMTRPALATVVILNFIYNWNEYLFALVLINDSALKTLPLGLSNFASKETTSYTLQMAALGMALLPILTVYLALEKQLVQGMTVGAVKG